MQASKYMILRTVPLRREKFSMKTLVKETKLVLTFKDYVEYEDKSMYTAIVGIFALSLQKKKLI